ncbi:TadE/TadG family type IV pilus assembly protein [Paremcibacter congregatus]|uniref:TadE-like domain-containing protein n=1 Tax=Paremcibacter congregatus TaxID=2043170 RepID=A0A2G4YRE0_9PROT|nr:TadE/TadG family type IV pilus assembly protein [Paremcibacter congregatus]PHZ84878.1 hypothetical protein CRD36_09130 [Paremcibacter congregatus]QDE26148.1 pilus assembly protein [Paremcibacter congregatus]
MLIHLRNLVIPRFMQRLRRSDKGTMLIEFAFLFPITLIMLLGGFETFRLLMAHRKANMTAMSIGNLISQNKVLSNAAVSNIFDAVDNIMQPLELKGNGQILVSYVIGTNTGTTITLQCRGTADTTYASKIGAVNNEADLARLPGNFTLAEFETVVVSEVVYRYKPVIINLSGWLNNSMFAAHDVYHVAVQKPRYGEVQFTSGCP